MALTFVISHFAPLISFFLLTASSTTTTTSAVDITALLSPFQNLSTFSSLLSSTPVAADLRTRSSLTILAVPNSYLSQSDLTRRLSTSALADLLRYHVLLQYLSWHQLLHTPPSGILVTTLLQTTGRAPANSGSVNLTRNAETSIITVHSPAPYSPANVTVLSLIETLPYNITVLAVDSLIVPYGFDLMASETRPPLGLNITKALIDGHNFNVAASMLAASGVVEEFEADESGAGITLFVPTDSAFADLPSTVRLRSLPADKKAVVLKFHVLHSYYPLGSLESIVNPVQPTLATEDMGAGRFTLNISRLNGSVSINSGIVQAAVTQTVFDQNPVAIFGISKVLLPREIFAAVTGNENMGTAPPPNLSFSPENSPEMDGPNSHLSSPPGFRGEITAAAGGRHGGDLRSMVVAAVVVVVLYSNVPSTILNAQVSFLFLPR